MSRDLAKNRERRRNLGQIIVTLLSVAFYLALVPIVVLLSGPIYHAVECTLGDCEPEGIQAEFVLTTRGELRRGSAIRLPNGEKVGEIADFRRSADERYTIALGRFNPEDADLINQPLRCQAMANFNLRMDADLVISACPGLNLPNPPDATHEHPLFVCGAVDHFERLGQQLRRFVLDHVRPGEPIDSRLLTGPCGTDNEEATSSVRSLLRTERAGP